MATGEEGVRNDVGPAATGTSSHPAEPVSRVRAGFGRAARALVLLYGWGVVVLLVARLFVDDGPPAIVQFGQLMHVVLAPALPMLGIACWRRWWTGAVPLAVGSLALLWTCSGWLPPARPLSAAERGPTLTVVTWNLGFGDADPALVARELLRIDPDVVAFQEVRTGDVELLFGPLRARYGYCRHFRNGLFSKAIVSRVEPLAARMFGPHDRHAFEPNYVEVTIPFDGAPLTITNLHPHKSIGFRGSDGYGHGDLMRMLGAIGARQSQVLVGDFNTTERSATYRRIAAAGFVDSFREAGSGPGFTFPVFGRFRELPVPPVLRIDYVWHTPDLVCRSCEVGPHAESDHHCVIAVLARR